jgi:hypothetical protein
VKEALGNDTPQGGADSQRRDERDSLFVFARLKHEGQAGEGHSVRVRNVSSGGLMADAPEDFRQAMRIEIALEGVGTVLATVAWAEAGRIGVAFDHPIDKTLARKPRAAKADEELFRPTAIDYRRPGLKAR